MQQANTRQSTTPRHIPQHRRVSQKGYTLEEGFEEIEARLERLRIAVEEFRDSSWGGWPGADGQLRPLADEMCQKQDALLWKMRVVKHFSGLAQRVLLADIYRSIADLEELAASILEHRI